MIEHALENGSEKIYLGIGGSATQDLGSGIITALGGRFLDKHDKELPLGGGALYRLKKIDLTNMNAKALQAEWVIACDVQNPLLGKEGTAHTYAKQKGASPSDIDRLEQGGICFAEVVKKQFGIEIHNLVGGGAAGGVSAGLFALLNASLTEGFELLAQHTGLKDKISNERGKWRELIIKNKTYPLMITFSPSYLIRYPENKKYSWEDLKRIKQKIENMNINF